MITLRILRYSSTLGLFTFLALTTFLVSSGRKGNALASPLGRDTGRGPNDKDPKPTEYPSSKQINDAFLGVAKHQTVLSAGFRVTGGTTWLYASSTSRISLYNAFAGNVQPFVYEGYGPSQGFSLFFERCTRLMIERSSGQVRVLSDWPNGPDTSGDCNFWRDVQFPSLQANQKVTSVWLVDRKAWQNEKQIWPEPKSETKPNDKPKPPNQGSGRRRGGRPVYGLTPLVLGGAGASGLTLGTGVGGLGTFPIVPPFDNTNDQNTENEPVTQITDVLPDIVGEAPSTFNDPAGESGIKLALGTEGMTGTSETAAGGNNNLFDYLDQGLSNPETLARRYFGLQARSGASCTDWFPSTSNTPFSPSLSDQSLDGNIGSPPSNFVAPGALSDFATVQVVQYDESYQDLEQTGHCHLEISIMNAALEVLGGLPVVDAPPGQDFTVQSQLPYAVHVSVGGGMFALATGEELTLNFGYALDTPYAKSWDMYDKSCNVGEWNNGFRGVYCRFAY